MYRRKTNHPPRTYRNLFCAWFLALGMLFTASLSPVQARSLQLEDDTQATVVDAARGAPAQPGSNQDTVSTQITVTLTANGFAPARLSVAVGDQVTWFNATEQTYVLHSGEPYQLSLPTVISDIPSTGGVQASRVAMPARSAERAQRAGRAEEPFGGILPSGGTLSYRFASAGDHPYYALGESTWRGALHVLLALPKTDGSVARLWNEMLLFAIRHDYARPTIHARNLFHSSLGMYDAWAAYDEVAESYLLGKTVDGFACPIDEIAMPTEQTAEQIKQAREESISYFMYRLIRQRFPASPGSDQIMSMADQVMAYLGYDTAVDSTDITIGPAALGNYLAQCVIDFGLQDGANEANGYANLSYTPVNEPLKPHEAGNPTMTDPNRWQPLALLRFIDQAGNPIIQKASEFLSPEWGSVAPFALKAADRTIYTREGYTYTVYHDPGPPPHLNGPESDLSDEYRWGFALVSIWASHLDPADGALWDISPAAIGNVPALPTTVLELRDFYDRLAGGDPGQGHPLNPVTGQPYAAQMVPRGDYARVLAEFWADGPDSETPPGHWFTILNYVNDQPALEKRYRGQGEILDELEWDVKAYFAMGGAVHDAAIAAWGIKGWYDFVRPVSAIRYMARLGQSSDPDLPNYHVDGIPLVEGYIELVAEGDPLVGEENEHLNQIKLYTWRGPDAIDDPDLDMAGVGWILAQDWWPYQRPTFVTPPFAGYVSGHSTYSRAGAELMTLLTGSAYFPGGMGEFHARQNEFLVFEEGPSVDVTLQWATYRDASDQCSLSRIWGGIHPPVDDMPGRRIGEKVGIAAFTLADLYFSGACVAEGVCTQSE